MSLFGCQKFLIRDNTYAVKNLLRNIWLFITNKEAYVQKHCANIKHFPEKIFNKVIGDFTLLLAPLLARQNDLNAPVFDAMFFILNDLFQKQDDMQTFGSIVRNLYQNMEKSPITIPPSLQLAYACNCLLSPTKVAEGTIIYGAVIGLAGGMDPYNYFQKGVYIWEFYDFMMSHRQYKEALQAAELGCQAAHNDGNINPLNLYRRSIARFALEDNQNALADIEMLFSLPESNFNDSGFYDEVEGYYVYLLALCEKHEDLDRMLLKQQERSLANYEKRKRSIKKSFEQHKENLNAQRPEQNKLVSVKKRLPNIQESSPISEEPFPYIPTPTNNSDPIQGKKRKIKTKGVANISLSKKTRKKGEDPEILLTEPDSDPSLDIVENIITGNAYRILCSIFNEEKTSIHDVQTLFNHMDKKLQEDQLGSASVKKAKGSHKKLSLNLRAYNINEEVMTLAHHTYLLPYQIKALKDMFVQCNMIPDSFRE